MPIQETVLFNERGVLVSRSRFVVKTHTYAIRNITSVRKTYRKADRVFGHLMSLVGTGVVAAAFWWAARGAAFDRALPVPKRGVWGPLFVETKWVEIRAGEPTLFVFANPGAGAARWLQSSELSLRRRDLTAIQLRRS